MNEIHIMQNSKNFEFLRPFHTGLADLGGYAEAILYNSVGNFSYVYENMVNSLGANESIYDYWNTNRDARTFRNVDWGVLEQYDYWADGFRFAADNYPYRCTTLTCPNTGDASFSLTYMDVNNEIQFASVNLNQVSYTSTYSLVPIPATVWLFGTGLILLIGIANASYQTSYT